MKTVVLTEPVEIQGKGTIKKLEVRAPKLGWLKEAQKEHPNDSIAMTQFLVAKCTGLVPQDLDDFTIVDFYALEQAVEEQSPEKKVGTPAPSKP